MSVLQVQCTSQRGGGKKSFLLETMFFILMHSRKNVGRTFYCLSFKLPLSLGNYNFQKIWEIHEVHKGYKLFSSLY